MPVAPLIDLEAAVDAFCRVRVDALAVAELQRVVSVVAPLAERLHGVVSAAVGQLQTRTAGGVTDAEGGAVPLVSWLRDAVRVSGREAGRQVRTAEALQDLPAIGAAVVEGTLTSGHAHVLARLVGRVAAEVLDESQQELIEVARRTDPEQLAHYVRQLIATWCEPELEAQESDAIAGRFLQLTNKHDGRIRGVFELPDADAEVLLTALEPLARRAGLDDHRTAGQRRADALVDVVGLALRHADLPHAGGTRPRLTYVLPAGDARADSDRLPPCATGAWTGPATAATVDRLLCDAVIDRLTLDTAGRVVDLRSSSDELTSAQRRAVAARDRCCTVKGCTRPPAFCDVHHLRARERGGASEPDNLVLLCRRHHTLWHRRQLGIRDLRVPWLRLAGPRAPAA